MRKSYNVCRIVSPWMSGVGAVSGLPMTLVRLGPGGRSLDPHRMAEEIEAVRRRAKSYISLPRYVALMGDHGYIDNDLLILLKSRLRVLGYTETDGRKPMCDETGRLPMWDHVAVRPKLPCAELRCELFHSVTTRGPFEIGDLAAFSAYLDKLGYNGPRYVEGRSDDKREAVAAMGWNWRLTNVLVPDDAGELV